MAMGSRAFGTCKFGELLLSLILWYLLTREEHRDFIKNGRLVMIDALSEFNHRRRARGGKDAIVQRDVDLICLSPEQNKHWLRIETIQMNGRPVDQYTLYGSELRQQLESLYQKSDTLKKIELIAAGILRKNYKFVCRLEEIETRVKNLSQRMNHAKEQLDALKIQLTLDKSIAIIKKSKN